MKIPVDEACAILKGERIGLLTNHTGVGEGLRHIADILRGDPRVNLVALYSPEHGLRGDAFGGEPEELHRDDKTGLHYFRHQSLRRRGEELHQLDERTGLPVYDLFYSHADCVPDMLKGIGALLFSIQDVGARFYTYISTMFVAMKMAAEAQIRFVVLDRPNPIGGLHVEGNIPDPEFKSLVSINPIPIRYGMTVGELAWMFNEECGIGADLEVIEMEGWRREMWYDETGLPWIAPSPNMSTLDTATVYPATNLLYGTNISLGRGTTKPFELIGSPWIKPWELADELNSLGLRGMVFREAYFVPTFSKWKGERCGGVQLHITDRNLFEPVRTGLEILIALWRLYPGRFRWDEPPSKFDIHVGTDSIRRKIEGGIAASDIVGDWRHKVSEFKAVRERYLIYD
ncbi:MAG: exo-beta-N-acetylmuramidase NamZ family protein [bacterium]